MLSSLSLWRREKKSDDNLLTLKKGVLNVRRMILEGNDFFWISLIGYLRGNIMWRDSVKHSERPFHASTSVVNKE
jgi:hypothetical protein